jgi:adenylate cyclase
MRLNPRDPALFTIQCGMAASDFFLGDYERAVDWGEKALLHYPRHLTTLFFQSAALALLGRTDDAKSACGTILEIIPSVRISAVGKWLPVKRPEILDSLREGLRLSGMPE